MRNGKGVKISIGRKIALAIAISVFVIGFASIFSVYFFGSNLLMKIIGQDYTQVARTLGSHTLNALNNEIENARSYATRPLWKDAVAEVNLKYSKMSKREIEDYMAQMDKKWSSAEKGSLFLIEYLRNRISLSMQETVRARQAVAEIFITDRYGGIVASSGKTSDYYQADEAWWQEAYNDVKGDIFVGNIEFDNSSGYWVIPIAVPLMDESGEAIGVLKYSVSIEKLFAGFADIKIGNTGHAVLMDDQGTFISHHTVNVMKERASFDKGSWAVFSSSKPYMITGERTFHNGKKMFIAFTKVDPPYLTKKGVRWFVLIAQEWLEVSRPLNIFLTYISVVALLMLILVIPLGYVLGGRIAKPIHELHIATEHVMAGDWDYVIKIDTGDELGRLADAFNRMIADIKSKQKELESFSKGLEAKVEERTKELGVAQEAALNILADLQASKEALETTNRKLLKLDELKSDFISTVSHELRTPLSIIKEGISLVLDKIPGEINEKQSKILDISKYNIDRLARIIGSLLDISKIEAGKVELNRSLINISNVVRQVASSFESRTKEKGLEMRLDIDKVSGSVWADADRITQVLTNLIGNAVKFTNSGHIDILCKDKDDEVVCSVSDTGVGISKDEMPKVFDKFQQFGRVAGPGDKGTGLGLSIAKGIIDMHNGAIWAESEYGKGTRFMFKLHKYTPESLFREYISKAVKRAADEAGKMSIIAVSSSLTGKDASGVINKRFNDIMHESASLIKSTLRREGDGVVNLGNEMIVILADCDRESAVSVQYRLEEIVGKYLADQNADGAIKVNYGYATYPDDAKSDLELIEKAKAALAVSAKA